MWDAEQSAEQVQPPNLFKIRPCVHMQFDSRLPNAKLEPVVLEALASIHPHGCLALQLAQALWPEGYPEGNNARAQLTRSSMQIKVASICGCSLSIISLVSSSSIMVWLCCQQNLLNINGSCVYAVEQCTIQPSSSKAFGQGAMS